MLTLLLGITFLGMTTSSAQEFKKEMSADSILTLDNAITLAQANDEWLAKSKLREQQLIHLSQGASALPDPTFSLSLLNMPTDSVAYDQEAMTQLKIGVSQMLPRGDSQSLTKQKYQLIAAEQPYQRIDRLNKISLQTSLLWLDAFKSAASYRLVNEAKPLFNKLTEIVTASYSSSSKNTNQQDIIRAELELVRLNDRLINLQTNQQVALASLTQYLFSAQHLSLYSLPDTLTKPNLIPTTLPIPTEIELALLDYLSTKSSQTKYGKTHDKIHVKPFDTLYERLTTHPLVSAIEQRILSAGMDIELADQAYKPQYSINASYAHRDDAPSAIGSNNANRADFFSIGVNVSLPLFSLTAQDAQVASNIKAREAMRTEKTLLLKELMAAVNIAYQTYLGSTQRYDLYDQQLLPQLSQQADAARAAYTNDIADIVQVIRAQIALLDARVTLVEITVAQRKSLATLAYYLSSSITQLNPHNNTHKLKSDKHHE